MKLIAFDWDQTLWDSWKLHMTAVQDAAGVLGLPAPAEERVASTFSVPFSKHMELLFPDRTEEGTAHYLRFYHSRVRNLGRLFEDVPEMLRTLKNNGYLVALLSDKREVYGSKELESEGIADLFDYVLFLDDGRAYKPDPQGLQQVMDALSIDREEVLYVGDSYVDIQCARRTGVASAAALWGSVNPEAVLREAPDYALQNVTDLLTTLSL